MPMDCHRHRHRQAHSVRTTCPSCRLSRWTRPRCHRAVRRRAVAMGAGRKCRLACHHGRSPSHRTRACLRRWRECLRQCRRVHRKAGRRRGPEAVAGDAVHIRLFCMHSSTYAYCRGVVAPGNCASTLVQKGTCSCVYLVFCSHVQIAARTSAPFPPRIVIRDTHYERNIARCLSPRRGAHACRCNF